MAWLFLLTRRCRRSVEGATGRVGGGGGGRGSGLSKTDP